MVSEEEWKKGALGFNSCLLCGVYAETHVIHKHIYGPLGFDYNYSLDVCFPCCCVNALPDWKARNPWLKRPYPHAP